MVHPLFACLWDSETLLQERARFPTTLEIITGKFPRHTDEYYKWRLNDRKAKLAQDPKNHQLLDDIAISHEKIGDHKSAIRIATEQLSRAPDRYETLANLGTFYIHNQQYKKGLTFIEKAIAVNPDAHFGRERYQAILVKYVLSRAKNGKTSLPLAHERIGEGEHAAYQSLHRYPFVEFLKQELSKSNQPESENYIAPAIKGVLGMMRFSNHRSPILLEVLGELHEADSALQLAFRCYTSAAKNVDDEVVTAKYRQLASNALNLSLYSFREQNKIKIDEQQIADDFVREQKDADDWFSKLATDELQWIAVGEDVDTLFSQKYRTITESISTDRVEEQLPKVTFDLEAPSKAYRSVAALACAAVMLLVLAFYLRKANRSNQQTSS